MQERNEAERRATTGPVAGSEKGAGNRKVKSYNLCFDLCFKGDFNLDFDMHPFDMISLPFW